MPLRHISNFFCCTKQHILWWTNSCVVCVWSRRRGFQKAREQIKRGRWDRRKAEVTGDACVIRSGQQWSHGEYRVHLPLNVFFTTSKCSEPQGSLLRIGSYPIASTDILGCGTELPCASVMTLISLDSPYWAGSVHLKWTRNVAFFCQNLILYKLSRGIFLTKGSIMCKAERLTLSKLTLRCNRTQFANRKGCDKKN